MNPKKENAGRYSTCVNITVIQETVSSWTC